MAHQVCAAAGWLCRAGRHHGRDSRGHGRDPRAAHGQGDQRVEHEDEGDQRAHPRLDLQRGAPGARVQAGEDMTSLQRPGEEDEHTGGPPAAASRAALAGARGTVQV